MLNLINVQGTDLVLDIGGGYGYVAALLSHFSQAVVMLEEPQFVKEAERILIEQSIDNVIVTSGALNAGVTEYGLYDAIMIEGGVDLVPESIVEQLKIGGRMVAIFINGAVGECRIGFRTVSGMDWRFGFNAFSAFLPMFKSNSEFIF
jgi:protein-L-isoaspartate(D-aspartate) O-methyltransferase